MLLGDFNTQEKANNHMCLWDKQNPNLPSNPNNGMDPGLEPLLLREHKEAFLAHYVRAVEPNIPTNVYPFLAGLVSEPKHNDDIWVPRNVVEAANRGMWEFSETWGRVVKIPHFVLRSWDNLSNAVFESMSSCALKAIPESELILFSG